MRPTCTPNHSNVSFAFICFTQVCHETSLESKALHSLIKYVRWSNLQHKIYYHSSYFIFCLELFIGQKISAWHTAGSWVSVSGLKTVHMSELILLLVKFTEKHQRYLTPSQTRSLWSEGCPSKRVPGAVTRKQWLVRAVAEEVSSSWLGFWAWE